MPGYTARFFDVEHTVHVSVTGGGSQHIRVVQQLPFLVVRNIMDSPEASIARSRQGTPFDVGISRANISPRSVCSPLASNSHSANRSPSPLRQSESMDVFPGSVPGTTGSESVLSKASVSMTSMSLTGVSSRTVLRKLKDGGEQSVHSLTLNLNPGQT